MMATEYRFGKPTIMDSLFYDSIPNKVSCDEIVILPDDKKSLPSRPKDWPKVRGDLAPKSSTTNLWLHTGSPNGLFVIDIDGQEGIDNFQRIFGKIEDIPTVITKTIRGGYHIYVKYHERIAKSMLNFKKMKIDILSSGRSVYEGKNYWLVRYSHTLCDGEIFFDYIEKYIKEEKEIRELNRKTALPAINDSIMSDILDSLGTDYYEKYNNWIQVLMALKNCGYSCGDTQ